jgi:rubrerythrin
MDKQMAALGMGEEPTETPETDEAESTDRKLLYCKQCGYVVLREEPPYKCPICGAKRELFGEIIVGEINVREI